MFFCRLRISTGKGIIPRTAILSTTFLSSGFITLPPSSIPFFKSSLENTINTPSGSISASTLRATKLPSLLLPIYSCQLEFETSILLVVEPIMSFNELTLIGVDELLQKEIKKNTVKTSLIDFTSLF